MNLRKQFTSVLTAEDGSYQGKSTDLNKENGTHGNGIIDFIGKRKSNTNVTHENNFAKNLYLHIVNCLSGDFLAKQSLRQQKVQKGDMSEIPKKGKNVHLKFRLPFDLLKVTSLGLHSDRNRSLPVVLFTTYSS